MRRLLIRPFFLGTTVLWAAVSWVFLVWRQHDHIEPTSMAQPQMPEAVRHVEYTNEYIPPAASFSACVMFKDDTHRLIEWMAYHYHVLPLRRIIIGVDEGSIVYPLELAKRYADRMKVTLWPKDVFASDRDVHVSERKKSMDAANQYIRRQTLFLRKCALQLKRENRGWTIFIDPDEYLLFNYPSNTTPPPTAPEEFHKVVLPSVRDEGIMFKFIQQQQQLRPSGAYANPCITVPRMLFGSHNDGSAPAMTWKLQPPPPLDTLRYRSHSNRDDFKSNRLAKTILDLQRVSTPQLENLKNVHAMIPRVCWNPMMTNDKSLLKLNHYLGSKQSFFHRKDDRDQYGRRENYEKFAGIQDGTDDTIRAWYDGFVTTQGQQVAMKLLEGAAVVS
jgi:hypothetical protein